MADISQQGQQSDASGISRRGFVKGAAALAAAGTIASVATMTGCGGSSAEEEISTLMVSSNNVTSFSDCTELPLAEYATLDETYTYPAGSMFWVATDLFAVVLVPGGTSNPLSYVSFLDLTSGEDSVVLEKAVGSDEGFEIYEVRASASSMIWTEFNFLTSDWRVYGATVRGTHAIDTPALFDEGNADFDAPLLTSDMNRGYWSHLPYEKGTHKSDLSYLKSRKIGDSEARIDWTSHGRLATIPERSDGLVTFVPRLDTSGIYYELVAIDALSGEKHSSLTLPASVKPLNAIYMGNAFSFTIEASYDSTSAIAQVGTYRDMGNNTWFRLNRASLCTPALCNGWFVCKYGKGTVAVKPEAKEYITIEAPDKTFDYGDFLASSGTSDRILTYATVGDQTKAASAQVVVRVWSLY